MAHSTLNVRINKLAAIIATWVVFGRLIEHTNESDLNDHVDAAYNLGYWPIYAAADDWSGLSEWQANINAALESGEDDSAQTALAVSKFIADHHGIISLEEGRKSSIRSAKGEAAQAINYCPKHGTHQHDDDASLDIVGAEGTLPEELAEKLRAAGAEVKVVKVNSLDDLKNLDIPDEIKDTIIKHIAEHSEPRGGLN